MTTADKSWGLSQGDFDSIVDLNDRRSDVRIIVIEFFLRLKIHRICADVPKFDIENLNFIVSMADP